MSEVVTYLKQIYYQSATFDIPPTDVICHAIDGAPKGTDVLGRILSGIIAIEGKSSCYLNESKLLQNEDDTNLGLGWQVYISSFFLITKNNLITTKIIPSS